TMLVRGSALEQGMSHYLVDQINGTDNIEVRLRSSIIEVIGINRLEQIVIRNANTDETESISADALFIFIGAKPHTEIVADVVECNKAGYILTGADLIKE